MPYRIDLTCPPHDACDLLVDLGALDIERVGAGLAAILPDSVTQDSLALQFPTAGVTFSAAVPRDAGSVWRLSPRSLPYALRLTDSDAFGTGHHPTTALCLEALQQIVTLDRPDRLLDVGTGSGILALAALMMGVRSATAIDIDAGALEAAAENARVNQLSSRIAFVLGGPDAVSGHWPLIVANILAAPLIEMAPALVQRLGKRGRLILSGIHSSLESEVRGAYQSRGIRLMDAQTRDGWTVLTALAPW